MLVGDFFPITKSHFSFAVDDEQDHIGVVVCSFAEISHGRDTNHDQFTEGSLTECLAKGQVLLCGFFDVVVERQDRCFRVPGLRCHGFTFLTPVLGAIL